ncbi:uncharacterized protein LOC134337691 [Mobula hypostoma]|uniref:uncharacterized protein LOC134337691 n=1 Tax=Mobula hypostoma TaxID=723540 RepID=UPI002FC3ABD9
MTERIVLFLLLGTAPTPVPVSTCKTQWFDRDNPSGQGDYEVLNLLRNEYPNRICVHPIACEVETTSGVPASQTGQIIQPCNVASGFFCVNGLQRNQSCQDYRIRFTCPESFCTAPTPVPVSTCKTQWFDRDNPSGQGDYEVLNLLRNEYPNRICVHPIACEVETTSGVPASQTGQIIQPCNVASGFFCVNGLQRNQSCQDYRIRFTCPESFCTAPTPVPVSTCKTQWFDRDNPSGQGDYEVLNLLRNEYPNRICVHPIACEVETTSGVPASQTGQIIQPCNVASGFFCVNGLQRNQSCQDYRIRFTCPESFCTAPTPVPVSTCKTQWFDRDNPSGQGDYEVLNLLRNEYPNRICVHPIACEVETTSGVPASQTGQIIQPCNVASGFFCVNGLQRNQSCQDYRIRFTCPESFCTAPTPVPVSTCKTQWFDRDNPSGQGDYEVLNLLRNEYPNRICVHPIACEVETTSGVPASQTGQIIQPCNVASGFFCVNGLQRNQSCQDYRIRFTCPESFCTAPTPVPVSTCKTQWFDRDNPSGQGDYEVLNLLRNEYPNRICVHPIACEVETTSGVPASQTGQIIQPCNVASGFFCVNGLQRNQSCQDYRIRFTCPESFCTAPTPVPVSTCKTQWFDRDNPSGQGDYEVLNLLRNEYPNRICVHPIACEVETTSGVPASQTGQIIQPCNVASGFFCVNGLQRNQSCQDYRIRFTCPESFCGKKTRWFDRDDPSGHGDFETLTDLRKEHPNEICSNPIACEVQTVFGKPASSTDDNIPECSILAGFFCLNKNQTSGMCEDYKIRFTCP